MVVKNIMINLMFQRVIVKIMINLMFPRVIIKIMINLMFSRALTISIPEFIPDTFKTLTIQYTTDPGSRL